jgi:thiamine-monophosphate kinase
MKLRRLNEDWVLKKILEHAWIGPGNRTALKSLSLGIGDDSALFRPQAGRQTILTCDWFLEGTHFLRDKHPPNSVGWKCLARAVSDVAAMGGKPRCFLLSLALPTSLTGHWLDAFLVGLRRASLKFQCPLAGGDTTRRDKILINVTVVGEAIKGHAVRRSGARAGHLLYVSGRLGEAELGLRLLKRRKGRASRKNPLIRKHLYPEPRLALGHWLASTGLASAMTDLSDGLSSDLMRLCAASRVGARLDATKIPTAQISPAMSIRGLDPLQIALHGGDDYELLFTVPSRKASLLPRKFRGVLLTPIGRITRDKRVLVVESDRTHQLAPGGWDPFRLRR